MGRISQLENIVPKTLHSAMAQWTLKDNDMLRKTLELEATSAMKRRRTTGIVPIRVTIY
jgi:hypothetical protein